MPTPDSDIEIVESFDIPSLPRKNVIIIGTSLSGIFTAKYLSSNEYNITFIDDSNINQNIFDLHPILKDDLDILKHFIDLNPITNICCPIFEGRHTKIPKNKCQVFTNEFNSLLHNIFDLVNKLNPDTLDRTVSIGEYLDLIINMHEKYLKEEQIVFLNEKIAYQEKLIECLDSLDTSFKENELLSDCVNLISSDDDMLEEDQNLFTRETIKSIRSKITTMDSLSPCQCYMGFRDRNLLDWMAANLELNLGGLSLYSLPVTFITHIMDSLTLQSSTECYLNGNEILRIRLDLLRNYQILQNIKVTKVSYGSLDGAIEIECVKQPNSFCNENFNQTLNMSIDNDNTPPSFTLKCHELIWALPLNQLFRAENGTHLSTEGISLCDWLPTVTFEPRLPSSWLPEALNVLTGTVLYVTLAFDHTFWPDDITMFGYNGCSTPESRGEFFLFLISRGKLPANTLITKPHEIIADSKLINSNDTAQTCHNDGIDNYHFLTGVASGDAAKSLIRLSDNILVDRCLSILKRLFGNTVGTYVTYYISQTSSYISKQDEKPDILLFPPIQSLYKNNIGYRSNVRFVGEYNISHCNKLTRDIQSGIMQATKIKQTYTTNK